MSELLDPKNLEINRKFNENFSWFTKNYGYLRNNFANKLVAIDDNDVLYSDIDINSLLKRLREKYNDIRHIVIQYVSESDNILTM